MDAIVSGLLAWLASLPAWASLLLITAALLLPALAVIHVLRRRVAYEQMSRHHEVAGFVFAGVGVIYGVLLAISVLIAFEHHRDTETATWGEAAALQSMRDLLRTSDDPQANDALAVLNSYIALVVADELSLGYRDGPSQAADQAFAEVWSTVPASVAGNDDAVSHVLLSQLSEADTNRTQRHLGADGAISTSMWIVLALGAAVTIGFSLLFSVQSYTPHLLVVAGIAVTVALVLFVVVQLNYPFVGTESIGSEAFDALL